MEKREIHPGAIIILGAQWGDECKGKISAHVADINDIEYIYRAGIGPNAEHGIYFEKNGPYIKRHQLPLGSIVRERIRHKKTFIRIGPGVCVDPDVLFAEIKEFGLEGLVKVDHRCPIVKEEYKKWERENLAGNSTYNGCGPCRSDFVLRKAKQARDIPELKGMLIDVPEEINRIAYEKPVLIECSQGTLLSLALSDDYPHVTSDNVTTDAAMDDVGLNWKLLNRVIMCVKSMPTRESSGPMGKDEIDEEELKKNPNLYEDSSIDGGKRRKLKGIDFERLAYATMLNGPTDIALTFLDHYDSNMEGVISQNKITPKVNALIAKIEAETLVPVSFLETGKLYNSIIDL